MLENLRIASPCPAGWEQMRGGDRVRHCEHCNLNVYNFSAMTERDIRELVAQREGRLCARLYRRRDGTIITKNCPVGVKAVARRISRIAGAVFSFLAATLSVPPASPAQPYMLSNVSSAGIWVEVRARDGSLLSQAKVTLLDPRNHKIEGVTDKYGRVLLWGAIGGDYRMEVSSPGFRTYANFVKLRAGEVLSNQVSLDVGAMTGLVVIEAPRSIPSRNAATPVPAGPMGGSPGLLR